VVGEQDIVEQRPVTVGRTVSHMRVIEDGLSSADRVIINGLQRARPGATVKPIMENKETDH
jgi:multidrug efflux system membrane fusion protein